MADNRPLRLGLFGLGRSRAYFNIIMQNNVEIVAACSMREEQIEIAKQNLGPDVTYYRDFDSFIEHDMDVVFLANFFHEHAPYAVRCLERGLHVLSECTANGTMADGVALVRAAEKAWQEHGTVYMLAENYPFMCFSQEMHRIFRGGSLGRAIFAEGEYNHPFGPQDINFLRSTRPTEKHWRNYIPASYYLTHSLAPLMYITGATPKRVSGYAAFAPKTEEYAVGEMCGDNSAILITQNDDNSVFRITGCAQFGGHGNAYRICGDKGSVENIRGGGGKVMLRYNPWNVPEGREAVNYYMPEWPAEFAEAAAAAGHGGGDFFVMHEFFSAIREGRRPIFDVHFATAMSSVAILGHRSILNGNAAYDIPDFHLEEDLAKYENDRETPFYYLDGRTPTIPSCSHPSYRPSDSQMQRYLEIIGR